jgi:ribose transport system ATP-binding protein
LLDEPTRGVDIGAKQEIQSLIADARASGLGVVMISSELDELVQACNRVVVLRDGRSVAELEGAGVEARSLIQAMAGEPVAVVDATREAQRPS